jgi:ubiquinone/menaquinone biosynthesis C-methylase UbiE
LDYTVLHTGTFVDLPFSDNSFSLTTSSLAIHNVSATEDKRRAIRECARVTKIGGWILIVDLKGNVALYEKILQELGWESIERKWAGMKMMYGIWPCEVLKAQKPQRTT